MFQAGTLYLDGARAAPVHPGQPTPASTARSPARRDAYLVYCDIKREGDDEADRRRAHQRRRRQPLRRPQRHLLRSRGQGLGRDGHEDRRQPDQRARGVLGAVQEARQGRSRTRSRKRAQAADAPTTAKIDGDTASTVGSAGAGRRRDRRQDASRPSPRQEDRPRHGRRDRRRDRRHRHRSSARCSATLFGLGKWLPIGIVALLLMISRPVDAARVAQAAPPQPRPDPRRQRLGDQRPRAHQRRRSARR